MQYGSHEAVRDKAWFMYLYHRWFIYVYSYSFINRLRESWIFSYPVLVFRLAALNIAQVTEAQNIKKVVRIKQTEM